MLWFSFILGSNFLFLCFKLIIIYHDTQKQRNIKFKPRTKLNHNTYFLYISEWECFCILDSPTIWYECHHVKCTEKVHVQCNCHSQLERWFLIGTYYHVSFLWHFSEPVSHNSIVCNSTIRS